MRYLFLIAAAAASVTFAKNEQRKAESSNPYHLYNNEYHHLKDDHHEELPGPLVLRSPHSHDFAKADDYGPGVKEQNSIIRKTYDPDYYEPTIVLDYRYLKTGGRDYTRGPGGQYLILPKGVHSNEPKEFENYDMFLEHLRVKNLAENGYKRYHGGKH